MAKIPRAEDEYSPGGKGGARPDRSATVYTKPVSYTHLKKRRRVQRGGYGTAYCQFHIIIKYTARETNVKYQTKKNKKITKN